MKVTRKRNLNSHQLDENVRKNLWTLVERGISMVEMSESGNVQVERILSNDYLIVENV